MPSATTAAPTLAAGMPTSPNRASSPASRAEELRDEAVVQEDRRQADPRDAVDERLPERLRGLDPALEPEPEAVEAPRRRPADQRPEHEPVEGAPGRPEPGVVVVGGEEPDAVRRRHVLPVAAALADDREGMGGPEAERRGAAAVRAGLARRRSRPRRTPRCPKPSLVVYRNRCGSAGSGCGRYSMPVKRRSQRSWSSGVWVCCHRHPSEPGSGSPRRCSRDSGPHPPGCPYVILPVITFPVERATTAGPRPVDSRGG